MPSLTRRDFLRLTLAGALLAGALETRAGDELLRLERAELSPKGEYYVLSGRYTLHFTQLLEEALHKGIVFAFIQAFEAERPRSYWFPETVAVVKRSLQLSYNALLRQYQVQVGASHSSFDSLADAVNALGEISDWAVLSRSQVEKNEVYQVRLRMYFDPTRLSKPLQLNAFASERWDMDSGWHGWTFKP